MVRAKGIFTWFLTLSCADLQWPETIRAIGLHHGQNFSDHDIQNMTYEEKCNWLRQNPVVAARQFDHRLQAFFKDVIQSASSPIGKVTHYYQRTEFQLRGSPHCHAVLWVEDAPDLDKSSDHEICSWIDTFVTCNLPPENDPLYEEVITKQLHSHSVACGKRGNICRFHYPKPPSDRTLLSKHVEGETEPLSEAQNAKHILEKVNNVLCDENTQVHEHSLFQLLVKANVSEEEYYKALSFSKSGNSIVYRRQTNSININNYNKIILANWKANMDLQFVCDPYACISYIAAYVTKDERELSQMMKNAAKELRDADVKARMRKIGSVYLSNREISAQEAAYRLLSIPLKRCSTKMVWIPTDLPDDRIGILNPKTVLESLEDEETDVFSQGIVKKYQMRPYVQIIENLSLWEFAAWYETVKKNNQDFKDNEDSLPKILLLTDQESMMKKRLSPSIPRYHVFSLSKESEKFYHQQLMLFYNWRNEESDLKASNSDTPYETKFEEVKDIVTATKSRLENRSELIEDALRSYDENGPPQHARDMLNPENEQRRLDDVRSIEDGKNIENKHIEVSKRHTTLGISMRNNTLRNEQLMSIIHTLNDKQRSIFNFIINWCKDVIAAKEKNSSPQPFHLFVTGGAGTGKSQLIKAIYHQAIRILQQPGECPDYPVVLLTSPTGPAAYNIGGTTLHAALHLPRGRYYSLRSNPSLLSTFKATMSQVKILVIDEISMVGRTMFAHIHKRLHEAKGTEGSKLIFGGVSILAVGDFYQLPPVHQHKIFDGDISDPNAADSEELSVILAGLWDNFFNIVELTEIMRQKEDLDFAQMLNRLRTAEILPEDIDILKSRVVSKTHQCYPTTALHIYPTRADVDDHNLVMLNAQDEQTIHIKAITKYPEIVKNYDCNQVVGGLVQHLSLCKYARIMLIKNLDIADGLVNGATGIVLDILYSDQSSSLPRALIVKFDNNKIGRLARQSSTISLRFYPDGVPIFPVEVRQNAGKSDSSPEIFRIQLPVVLCWACTIHKVQGQTLNNVVISFHKLRTKGQAYVALSRATSLGGLFLQDFNEML